MIKAAYCSNETADMKTITDYADEYVGHPQEIDEDLSVYSKREAYKDGMKKAFELVNLQMASSLANDDKFPVLHIMDYIFRVQYEKEG